MSEEMDELERIADSIRPDHAENPRAGLKLGQMLWARRQDEQAKRPKWLRQLRGENSWRSRIAREKACGTL